MVRNVKVLEGKEYTTRKIRKVIIDDEESESREDRNFALKEKNRQSAQRSRDNKKRYIVGLELRISELETQNQELKHKLAACQCQNKPQEAKSGNAHHTHHEPVMNTQNLEGATDQTESGGDTFERLSVRSFVSCSNFLMLALIAVCCVFGLLEHHGSTPIQKGLFYGIQTLEHIIQRARYANCDAPSGPMTPENIHGRPNCPPIHSEGKGVLSPNKEANTTIPRDQNLQMQKL